LKDARIVPGPARAIHLHCMVDASPGRSRGQRRGIARVDGRAKEGRLFLAFDITQLLRILKDQRQRAGRS
jgi:hypothetical protein